MLLLRPGVMTVAMGQALLLLQALHAAASCSQTLQSHLLACHHSSAGNSPVVDVLNCECAAHGIVKSHCELPQNNLGVDMLLARASPSPS